jgi:hypothetical protein
VNPVKQPSRERQGLLFPEPFRDFPFRTSAGARTFYGAAVEEIACGLLDLNPMVTDARFKTCYDAERDGQFYEIKSVKRRGGCIIFKKRLDNDEAAGVPLSYVFVSHEVTGARSNRQLWAAMAESKLVLWVVPFALVKELCAGLPVRKHYTHPEHGSMRYGYEKGYHVLPLARLADFPAELSTVQRELYDFRFSVNVRRLA